MKKIVRLTEGDLTRIVKKTIKESNDKDSMSFKGGKNLFNQDLINLKMGLSSLENSIKDGDTETALHIIMGLRERIRIMES
jgi:hypothetical protein